VRLIEKTNIQKYLLEATPNNDDNLFKVYTLQTLWLSPSELSYTQFGLSLARKAGRQAT